MNTSKIHLQKKKKYIYTSNILTEANCELVESLLHNQDDKKDHRGWGEKGKDDVREGSVPLGGVLEERRVCRAHICPL